jgi:hypothetical protein
MCKTEQQAVIDTYFSDINRAIHEASKEAGIVPKKSNKPKSYWCPELSLLRDRKRFWWGIWVDNGRPREGIIYDCWKGVKKQFRQITRNQIKQENNKDVQKLDSMFHHRQTKSFWNKIKQCRQKGVNTTLEAKQLAEFYKEIMTDDEVLNNDQKHIKDTVGAWFDQHSNQTFHVNIEPDKVRSMIANLNRHSSPGWDGITVEHLHFGESDVLCKLLASVYSAIISWSVIPKIFTTGIIIPLLKKATLNPNDPTSYRPLTLSVTHAKLLEMFMMPDVDISDTQFGFRQGRGVSFGCSLLNDVTSYFRDGGSPLYICSLDAENALIKSGMMACSIN